MKKFFVLITIINIGLLAGIIFFLQKNVEKEVPIVQSFDAQAIDRVRIFLPKRDYVITKELNGMVVGAEAVQQKSYEYKNIDESLLMNFKVYKEGEPFCTIDGKEITAAHDMRLLSFEKKNNNLTVTYLDYSLVAIEMNYPADRMADLSYDLTLYVTIGETDYEKPVQRIGSSVMNGYIPVEVKQEGYLLPGTEVKGYFIEEVYHDVVTLPTKHIQEDNRGYYLWTDSDGNDAQKVYYTVILRGEETSIISINEEYANGYMQTEFY